MEKENAYIDYAEVFEKITCFIRDYADNIKGDTKFIIGISGGIDSALCAALCVQSVGAKSVRGLYMPSFASSSESEKLSYELADALNMRLDVVEVGSLLQSFVENFEVSTNSQLSALSVGNISARIRMATLMAATNEFGGVMVNTGNLTEKLLGYYTLYGDGTGAIAPIASLLKTDVWNLSRYINENVAKAGEPDLIPACIISRKPTAELVCDQFDEDDFGASYIEIDECIMNTFNSDFIEDEMTSGSLAANLYSRYISNKFKKLSNIAYPEIRKEQEKFMQNN